MEKDVQPLRRDILAEIMVFIPKHGMSEAAFTRLAGISSSWISKAKTGKCKRMNPDAYKRVCAILDGKKTIPVENEGQLISTGWSRHPKQMVIPSEFEVMPLLKRIAERNKPMTFGMLMTLIQAEHTLASAEVPISTSSSVKT